MPFRFGPFRTKTCVDGAGVAVRAASELNVIQYFQSKYRVENLHFDHRNLWCMLHLILNCV